MIDIVSFKWKNIQTGYKLKNQVDYSATHVNILFRSIKRNTTVPFRFHCVTDDPDGLDGEINYIPLWNKCRDLGGCYNRLFMFSYEMRKHIGKRIMMIDLDCVIVSNIDHILLRSEDFVINEYRVKNSSFGQLYNGGLILMNAGSRKEVWEKFDPLSSPQLLDPLRESKQLQGSDQAWIQYVLGTNESTFTNLEGVFDYKQIKSQLPSHASMIFFPGREDPQIEKNNVDWVSDHWRL